MTSCSQNNEYAVVRFLSDCTYSEVPKKWLIKNVDSFMCWWPPQNSNTATLIANCVNPNYDLWNKYEVEVVKYCSSLESARKNAADELYHTRDEERFGRGKRQHVPYQPYTTTSDEDCEKQKEYESAARNKKKRLQSNSIMSKIPSCPDNFGSIVQDGTGKSTPTELTPKEVDPLIIRECLPDMQDLNKNSIYL
ncbi:uncharacterized protein LOC113005292 isoform X5 [Solenopsis invicta]|nr:uncharacterized protein LOC113005292 isoform X5 [Solenopsis invicta]